MNRAFLQMLLLFIRHILSSAFTGLSVLLFTTFLLEKTVNIA